MYSERIYGLAGVYGDRVYGLHGLGMTKVSPALLAKQKATAKKALLAERKKLAKEKAAAKKAAKKLPPGLPGAPAVVPTGFAKIAPLAIGAAALWFLS